MEIRKKNKSRGFTLFTPLVGTSVIMITIFASVAMVQSDIRLMRGISNAYVTVSEATTAKLVKGAAMATVLSQMSSLTQQVVDGLETACNDQNSCYDETVRAMTGTGSNLAANLRGADGIFFGLESNIALAGGRNIQADIAAMSNAIPQDAIDPEFNANGELAVGFDATKFAGLTQTFSVAFDDDKGNRIRVSIIPNSFAYTTTGVPLQKIIDKSITLFLKGISDAGTARTETQNLFSGLPYSTIKFYRDGATALELEVKFSLNGKDTTLIYHDPGFDDASKTLKIDCSPAGCV